MLQCTSFPYLLFDKKGGHSSRGGGAQGLPLPIPKQRKIKNLLCDFCLLLQPHLIFPLKMLLGGASPRPYAPAPAIYLVTQGWTLYQFILQIVDGHLIWLKSLKKNILIRHLTTLNFFLIKKILMFYPIIIWRTTIFK